jgi:hypothetical protein
MTWAPRVTSMVNRASAASPRTTSTSSGTGPEPERLTIRTVSPRRSKASSVARPIAPVPEDDVTCGAAHVLPTTAASTRAVPVGALCMGRSQYNKSPERAENVTAPLAPNMVNCSSTGIPARVVRIQPSAAA